MSPRPDFYKQTATVLPGKAARFDYAPRELRANRWQFFFDSGAVNLELTSVSLAGGKEELVQHAPAIHFVFALPELMLSTVRVGQRAELAVYNPTAAPVELTVWIGERAALQTELARLQE